MSYNAEFSNTQYKNLEDFLPQPPSATVDIPSTTDYPITEGIAISNKEGFIFKVLNYVICQLFVTSLICSIAYANRDKLYSYLYSNPGIIFIPFIICIISLGILYCVKNYFVRLTLFILFTISLSINVAYTVILYSPDIIFKTVFVTTAIVISTNIYAYYCAKKNRDFSFLESILFNCLMCLFVLLILQLFIQSIFVHIIIIIFGVTIFTGLLLYDLNRLYTDDNCEEDPLFIAIAIYLDIINLFLYLLQLIKCITDISN